MIHCTKKIVHGPKHICSTYFPDHIWKRSFTFKCKYKWLNHCNYFAELAILVNWSTHKDWLCLCLFNKKQRQKYDAWFILAWNGSKKQ